MNLEYFFGLEIVRAKSESFTRTHESRIWNVELFKCLFQNSNQLNPEFF